MTQKLLSHLSLKLLVLHVLGKTVGSLKGDGNLKSQISLMSLVLFPLEILGKN